MPRNRKNQSAALRFGPALKALLVCALIGGSGVGYISLQQQVYQLAQTKMNREQQLDQLREQNRRLAAAYRELTADPTLEARIRDLHLDLVPAQPAQVVRLPEPPEQPAAKPSTRQYAGDPSDPH